MNIEVLKEHIIANYDPDDIIEALELSTEELVDAFIDRVELNAYKFMEDEE